MLKSTLRIILQIYYWICTSIGKFCLLFSDRITNRINDGMKWKWINGEKVLVLNDYDLAAELFDFADNLELDNCSKNYFERELYSDTKIDLNSDPVLEKYYSEDYVQNHYSMIKREINDWISECFYSDENIIRIKDIGFDVCAIQIIAGFIYGHLYPSQMSKIIDLIHRHQIGKKLVTDPLLQTPLFYQKFNFKEKRIIQSLKTDWDQLNSSLDLQPKTLFKDFMDFSSNFTEAESNHIIYQILTENSQYLNHSFLAIIQNLIREESVLRKLTDTIRAIPDSEPTNLKMLNHLTYLEYVLSESARLNPIYPFSPVLITKTKIHLDTVEIPTNTKICIDVEKINHDSEIWIDPDTFNPERFSEDPKLENYFYRFGLYQSKNNIFLDSILKTTLFILLKNYDISIVDSDQISLQKIS